MTCLTVKYEILRFTYVNFAELKKLQKDQRMKFIQGVSGLEDITAGGDFLSLCDQKSSYKHVSDFGRLRSYGHFLIPVHALVSRNQLAGDVLNLVAYLLRCQHYFRHLTRAVRNRAAACVAAGCGIFENQL